MEMESTSKMAKEKQEATRDSVFEDSTLVKARRERLKKEVGDASGDKVEKATDRVEIEGTEA